MTISDLLSNIAGLPAWVLLVPLAAAAYAGGSPMPD